MARLCDVVTTFVADGDGYGIDAPADWSQGRTLYGGMTAALAHDVALRAVPDLPPLRSAQFAYLGPASGMLRFTPRLLRRGRSTMVVGVDCVAEAGPAARATFFCGADRDSRIAFAHVPAPAALDPDACSPRRMAPGFSANFDICRAVPRPADARTADYDLWVRFRDADQGVSPTTALLALADVPPPAAMALFPHPAPISTMTWTVDLVAPPPADADWVRIRSVGEGAGTGYSQQAMTLWDRAGGLIAVGRQAVAIFI